MTGVAATNVADLLRNTASRAAGQPAIAMGGGESGADISWADLDVLADAVGAALLANGLSAGDRVALMLGNTIDFIAAYAGALRAGLVTVPIDPGSATGELARRLADAGARMVITGPAAVQAVRGAVAGIADALTDAPEDLEGHPVPEVVVAGALALPEETAFADLVSAGRGSAAPASSVGGDDLAVLLYTSGASGRPQAVMLSHRALLAVTDQLLALEPAPITADDVVLGALPLSHVYGLGGVLGPVLATGAKLVLVEKFHPAEVLQVIRDRRVTSLPVAPQMLLAWADRDDLSQAFESVRVLVSGAAPLPSAVAEEIETATGVVVHEGYGLTEAASAVTTTLASPTRKLGSVGRPLRDVELRLVDEDGSESEGDPGEILIRAPNLFAGYWPDGSGGPRPDGWWRTGDVGYLDADGDLFLVDRVKDLVLVSGFNVYPREVEDVLEDHPLIAEAAVVGVPHPRTGEAVKAFVVLKPGATLDPAEIVAWSRERLARFKAPTIVSVVSELPYTTVGKIRRGDLR